MRKAQTISMLLSLMLAHSLIFFPLRVTDSHHDIYKLAITTNNLMYLLQGYGETKHAYIAAQGLCMCVFVCVYVLYAT